MPDTLGTMKTSENNRTEPADIWNDPVSYLASLGLETELVDEPEILTSLAAAA